MVKVKYDKKKKDWIVLPKGSKDGMYLDGYLYNTLSHARDVMFKKDVDLPIIVAGYPGTGKTTFTITKATFCDPSFNVDRMCLDVDEFIKALKNAKPHQAVVLDESYEGLNSAQIRRDTGRALLNMLNVIRQKRLYIFIVLPNFFDLSKSIAIFRSRYLFVCYDEDFGDIGRFVAFGRDTKQKLYMHGKRFEDYNATKSDFYGTFQKDIPKGFDYQIYLKKKAQAMMDIKIEGASVGEKDKVIRNKLVCWIKKTWKKSNRDIADKSGLSIRMVQNIVKDKIEEGT